jgi:hypothetical protein
MVYDKGHVFFCPTAKFPKMKRESVCAGLVVVETRWQGDDVLVRGSTMRSGNMSDCSIGVNYNQLELQPSSPCGHADAQVSGLALGQKRFVLAAKTGFCWRARHPPATLSQ